MLIILLLEKDPLNLVSLSIAPIITSLFFLTSDSILEIYEYSKKSQLSDTYFPDIVNHLF